MGAWRFRPRQSRGCHLHPAQHHRKPRKQLPRRRTRRGRPLRSHTTITIQRREQHQAPRLLTQDHQIIGRDRRDLPTLPETATTSGFRRAQSYNLEPSHPQSFCDHATTSEEYPLFNQDRSNNHHRARSHRDQRPKTLQRLLLPHHQHGRLCRARNPKLHPQSLSTPPPSNPLLAPPARAIPPRRAAAFPPPHAAESEDVLAHPAHHHHHHTSG